MKNPLPFDALEARPDDVTYTLKVLDAGEGDGLRRVLFQRIADGEAIEIKAETDAENLLSKLPDLLEAALEIQRAVWPGDRPVGEMSVSPSPMLKAESQRIRRLAAPPSGAAERREIMRRQIVREGIIVRDLAWEALHNALGPDRRQEIDALVGFHEPPAILAESMDRIAAYIERMLRSSDDAAILVACDVDAAYAASLRRHAAAIREAESAMVRVEEDEPRRRGLLRLLGTAYRAIRAEALLGGEPM